MYPGHFDVRRVTNNGCMKWHSRHISLSHALVGEDVGLEEIDDGAWAVFFGPVRLGTFDERVGRVHPIGRLHGGRASADADAR